jgi:hypothetical protein
MELENATIKKLTAEILTCVAARDVTQFHSLIRCDRSLSVSNQPVIPEANYD